MQDVIDIAILELLEDNYEDVREFIIDNSSNIHFLATMTQAIMERDLNSFYECKVIDKDLFEKLLEKEF